MSDLVERLTKYPSEDMEDAIPLLSEAADRIEELECEKARLANYMHRVEDAVKAFALERWRLMLNDKELADKVVALGVGNLIAVGNYQIGETTGLYADQFVRDWRVAGALMEKCLSVEFITVSRTREYSAVARTGKTADAINESLPRAINEACVEALDE